MVKFDLLTIQVIEDARTEVLSCKFFGSYIVVSHNSQEITSMYPDGLIDHDVNLVIERIKVSPTHCHDLKHAFRKLWSIVQQD